MTNEYIVVHRIPAVEEYKTICTAVGWENYMNFEAAEQSLKQSLFGVVIRYNDETVGMGRVVGDGHIYFYVQDIAVKPEHQGKGIGSLIMGAITKYLQQHAPDKAFVGLFSAAGKEPFYNRYGFQRHDGMTGMFGVIHDGKVQ